MCVIMKRNTVLPGKAYWYYITVNGLLIYRTPTCTEDTRAGEFFLRQERHTLITGKRSRRKTTFTEQFAP